MEVVLSGERPGSPGGGTSHRGGASEVWKEGGPRNVLLKVRSPRFSASPEWVRLLLCAHTVESAEHKPPTATRMSFPDLMLRERSQTPGHILCNSIWAYTVDSSYSMVLEAKGRGTPGEERVWWGTGGSFLGTGLDFQ